MIERNRVRSSEVREGDRVAMAVQMHGADTNDTVEYDRDLHKSVVVGEVIDAPNEATRALMAEGMSPMADIAVETDSGEVFRYNVDNGYVLGHHNGLGRRSDIGRFAGFFEV